MSRSEADIMEAESDSRADAPSAAFDEARSMRTRSDDDIRHQSGQHAVLRRTAAGALLCGSLMFAAYQTAANHNIPQPSLLRGDITTISHIHEEGEEAEMMSSSSPRRRRKLAMDGMTWEKPDWFDEVKEDMAMEKKGGDRPAWYNTDSKSVPHKLWFTYSENIFLTDNRPQGIYDNVQKTIRAYTEVFPDVEVNFLTDVECENAVREVLPDLVPMFKTEMSGPFRGDMCRSALLYMHGGYYFDVDLEVIEPYVADSEIGFASVLSCSGHCFFQAFMMSKPRHWIHMDALKEMLRVYRLGKGKVELLGPMAVYSAWAVSPPHKKLMGIHLMEEIQLDVSPEPQLYPEIPRQVGHGHCNYVVSDNEANKAYFYSRFLGNGPCRAGYIPERLWIVHETNALEVEDSPLYENAMKIQTEYTNLWGVSVSKRTVRVVDMKVCEQRVKSMLKELYPYFMAETSTSNKLEICKLALLHYAGGYAINPELQMEFLFEPDPDVTFATTAACPWCFSNEVMASTPSDPVLVATIENIKTAYENNNGDDTLLVNVAMANAYHAVPAENRYQTQLLERKEVEGVSENGESSFIVQNAEREITYFIGHSSGLVQQS